MTNDGPKWATAGLGSVISFGVEGVPYSQVRVELGNWASDDGAIENEIAIRAAVRWAKVLADEYAATFYPPFADTGEPQRVPITDDVPPWAQDDAPPNDGPRFRPAPTIAAQAAIATGQRVRVSGERFACPDCGQPVKQSLDKYQRWDVGDDGREYPASWYCPNTQCRTKSLWRSKLAPLAR